MERVPYIDSSGANALEAFVRQAHGEARNSFSAICANNPHASREIVAPITGAERATTFQSALDQVSTT